MARFARPKRDKDQFRINWDIKVPQVRVIDDEGGMVGVMAPGDAIKIAQEKGLDLIEISPNATPPTCKIMDYGKYKYEQKKKAQVSKKKQVQIEIKELQLRPRTDQHDIDVKLKHARRFLEEGDKVKFSMRFRGREMAHQEYGREVLLGVLDKLKDLAVVEASPRMEGRQLFAMVGPDPVRLKEIQKQRQKEAKAQEAKLKKEEKEKPAE